MKKRIFKPNILYPSSLTFVQWLNSCPGETLITVWSMQHQDAVTQLESAGQLTGEPKFTFDAQERKIGTKSVYSWMQEQLRHRLPIYGDELPIWGLLAPPSETLKRTEDRLLRLEIPKKRMLISYYQPWCKLLNIMGCLEKNKANSWPEYWLSHNCPYLSTSKSEQEAREYVGGAVDPSGPRTSVWDEQECRGTWERMFDLTLAQADDFLWKPICLQTMLPMIYSSDLREVLW